MTQIIRLKVIKPARINDKAFRGEINRAMRETLRTIREDFGKTTKTWKRAVDFEEHERLGTQEPSPMVRVDTDNEIYGYVNDGTRPHPIWAGIYTGKSDKKALAFPSVFSPKTTPGIIGSQAGSSGGATRFAPYVQHPGTEARKFDEAIKKEREPWFRRRMERAMRDAARASGHSL